MPESDNPFVGLGRDLLIAENARRASFEARAGATISASGAFVTLTLAITTFVRHEGFVVPGSALIWIVSAACFFVVAAALAVLVNLPGPTTVVDVVALNSTLPESWEASREEILKTLTDATLKEVASVRRGNRVRARFVICSLVAQLVAVSSLGVASALMLVGAS